MTAWNTSDANNPWLGSQSFSGGDLTTTVTAGGFWVSARATTPVDAATADHYFEVDVTSFSSYAMVGVCLSSVVLGAGGFWAADGYGYYSAGDKYDSGGGAAYGASYGADRIGVHLKAGKLYFLKNGVYQNSGDPDAGTGYAFTGLTGDFYPVASLYDNGNSETGAFAAADLIDLPAGAVAWDGSGGTSVTGGLAGDLASIAGDMAGLLVPTGGLDGDLASISGEMVGLLVPTGDLAGDVVGIAGSMAGESGVIGAAAGELPSIAGDFPGGQGFFAALAGDVVGIAGDMPGIVAQSGDLAGDLPLIAGEFIGGYSVAGTVAGDLPLISGAFAGYTSVASTLDGNLPLIAGSFVGGMATVGALVGDLPGIGGAFNDGPVGVFGGGISLHTGDLPGYVGTAASGRWLYLHTVPPAQVYAVDSIRGRLNPYLPAHRVDWSASDVRAEVGRTNDSWAAELVGASADLRSRIALQSPYGIRVDLYDGGEIVRSGVSFGVGYLDRALTIDVQSDVWTRDIPMRTSADLGTFRDVETLPIRYGRNVPGKLISINQARTLWLWADHASLAIRSVTIDGQPSDGWTWRNDIDASGHPITVVQTVEQIDDGADMVAVGDGALDATTGALLVNPADIARDVCTRGGLAVDRGDFAAYRAECLARNLELSGTVEGGSLQSVMTRIAESTHSAFARQLAGYLRLLPLSAAASATVAPDSVLRADLEGDMATRLRVRYGVEEKGPRRSIEVRAAAIERQHGVKSMDVELPLIRDDRSAADVASRMLGQLSLPAYRIQCKRQLREWMPGEVASVSVLALGISGSAIVQSSQIGERSSTPTLLLHVGTAPTISLVTVAQAYTPEPYAGATVATQGSNRIITITDDTGRPIAGAACTLDGSLTRTSDSAGRVSFPVSAMPPGAHTIDVIATGYSPFRLTVVI